MSTRLKQQILSSVVAVCMMASILLSVVPLEKSYAVAPILSSGVVNRANDTTGTVSFYSDKAGTYYYSIVPKDDPAPTIDTSGVGASASVGENTITNPTGLTAGAKDLYVKVKDTEGVVSEALKITINLFPTWNSLGDYTAKQQESISMTLDSSNNPYVLYKTTDGKLTLRKYNGSSWELVGPADFNSEGPYAYKIALNNGTPYIVYKNSTGNSKLQVKKYDGASWVNVGGSDISVGEMHHADIAFTSTGVPYVAYCDQGVSYKTVVKKFNGTTWEVVGIEGFSAGMAAYQRIKFDKGDVPYVSFLEQSISPSKFRVMKFDGSAWVNVGSSYVSDNGGDQADLAMDLNGILYLTYRDTSNQNRVSLKRFVNSSWEYVGAPFISRSGATEPFVAINSSGTPYVAFIDSSPAGGGKMVMYKWNGTAWENKGGSELTAAVANYYQMYYNPGRLSIGTNDQIYLSYVDKSTKYTRVLSISDIDLVPNILAGSVSRTSDTTGTVSFTSDKAGAYYYSIVAKDASAPTIDTSGAGTSAIVGTNTITDPTGLASGAKDIYIKVKGLNGYVSDALKITINTFPKISSVYVARTSDTQGAVVFNSDKAGQYYYSIVAKDSAIPTIDTSGTGISAVVGDNTITDPTGLTQGSKDIYIKVKDADGFVSEALKITINVFPTWNSLGDYTAKQQESIAMALDSSNNPYVLYKTTDGKLTLRKYNGSSWELVGPADFNSQNASTYKIAIYNGTPYISYKNMSGSGKLQVIKYNGSSWVNVGGVDLSVGLMHHADIAFTSTGVLYVAYCDQGVSYKTVVKKFNGTTWEVVGIEGFSEGMAAYQRIKFDKNDVPYVSFLEQSVSPQKLRVMKFNGSAWVNVGSSYVSDNGADQGDLAIDPNGIPYLTYKDTSNQNRISLKRFVNSSWEYVGAPFISRSGATEPFVAINSSGTPYVAFIDNSPAGGGKMVMYKWNGTTWENKGGADYTAAVSTNAHLYYFPGRLSIGTNDQIYLSYVAQSTKYARVLSISDIGLVPNISAGSVSRTSDTTGTVSFTSDKAGAYYYSIVAKDASAPTIDTSGAGTSAIAGTNTITDPAGLASGAKDIYIKVKGLNGYVSDALKITINTFPKISSVYVARTNDTQGTVIFNSSKAGQYYYSIVAKDSAIPTIDTSGTGISAVVGDNTITDPTGLTQGTKDLYIKVKDADGFVSDALKITIDSLSTWENVGTYATDVATNVTSMAVDKSTGTVHMAYRSGSNLYVKKYNGSSWVNVGGAVTSTFQYYFSLALYNGTPYIAFRDATQTAKVSKFDGASWVSVGSVGSGSSNFHHLTIDNSGTPYIAYCDNTGAVVKKYNGSSWVNVGTSGFTGMSANFPQMKFDKNNVLYYAFQSSTNVSYVMKFNGSSWVSLGNPFVSQANCVFPVIDIDNDGILYVAGVDATTNKISVVKYINSAWEYVGAIGISPGAVVMHSIAIDSFGRPIVSYIDQSLSGGGKMVLCKWNGTTWAYENGSGFTTTAYFDSNNYWNSFLSGRLLVDSIGKVYMGYVDSTTSKVKVLGILDSSIVPSPTPTPTPIPTPVITAGTVTRTSDTSGTVSFTSSKAGQYYYSIVASGAAAPTIDTSGAGIAAIAGSNSITNPTGLTQGPKDIYIKIKDSDGLISNLIKVTIPEFPAISAATVSRKSDTKVAVRFTSNVAGACYYAIVNDGASAPTVDTSGSGFPVVVGANTFTDKTYLTAGDKDIYFVIKDIYGNISNVSKLDIATYVPVQLVYNASSSPNPFIAVDNTSLCKIQFSLSENAYVTAQVYDSDNSYIATIYQGDRAISGATLYWNGKSGIGARLPDSTYKYKLNTVAADDECEAQYVGTFVMYNYFKPATTIEKSDTPLDTFKPTGSNSITIPYTLSSAARVITEIFSGNKCIMTLESASLKKQGQQSITWDGKLYNGTIAPDGLYTYKVFAFNLANAKSTPITGTFKLDNNSPVISGVSVSPATINPSFREYSTITYTLSEKCNVTAKVYDGNNSLVRELTYTDVQKGNRKIVWDGKDSNGDYATNGVYTITLSAMDQVGEAATPVSKTVNVCSGASSISNTSVSANPFIPTGSNTVQISYTLSSKARVTLNIMQGSTTIKILEKGVNKEGGNYSIDWDGKNLLSQVVPDATYTYTIFAVNAMGYISSWATGNFVVDSRSPSIIINNIGNPMFGAGGKDSVKINFTLSENANVTVKLLKDSEVIKTLLSSNQTKGYKSISWDGKDSLGSTVQNGLYTVAIDATDVAGNQAAQVSQNISVCSEAVTISNSSVNPDPFTPTGSNAVSISYSLPYKAKVTVYIMKGSYVVKALHKKVYKNAGNYSVTWNGRDSWGQIVHAGTYTYKIMAVNDAGYVSTPVTGSFTVR